MKIAIAKTGETVSEHFGHCDGFEIVEVNADQTRVSTFLKNPGHTPGFLPKYLAEQKVDVIIAGGMGSMAQNLFAENKIEVIIAKESTLNEVVDKYIEGTLESTDSVCDHHSHSESCGEHE